MALNSFGTQSTISIGSQVFLFHALKKLPARFEPDLKTLPFSLLILLENLLRHEDGKNVRSQDIEALLAWNPRAQPTYEIQFTPGRVLLQDFTGVPVVADLTAMRSQMQRLGGDPVRINPLQPVDLVIDHSVQVDSFGKADSLAVNTHLELQRNQERYQLLKWAQKSFNNFRVVPPATGICHQVNLEHLASVAQSQLMDGERWIYPDTVVGTDSHTPMVNGLGVLGWGAGGIEAEAAMLGQACSMLIPQVIAVHMSGKLSKGVTSTDLVLTVTQMLRKKGVVGQFVEFIGPGVESLSVSDRATVSNMVPEYGATVGLFPVDQKTLDYLRLTGRAQEAERTEKYFKEQNLFFDPAQSKRYSDIFDLDLSQVQASAAGPSRPHDRWNLSEVRKSWQVFLKSQTENNPTLSENEIQTETPEGSAAKISHGSILIAAITSCTNTSNPTLMIGAALLAKKANEFGLKVPWWVKTSFAPGSKVVTDYLESAGLMKELDRLGFNLVGYGCTTCIGNSGPLPKPLSEAIEKQGLISASVLSGNRNFEARINPLVAANYLMSPPLVVAYALAGHINVDLNREALGRDRHGNEVFLADLWPSPEEIERIIGEFVRKEKFERVYQEVFRGSSEWENIDISKELIFPWDPQSTYIQEPPFPGLPAVAEDLQEARILGLFGDFITTDHISPAGSFNEKSVAGHYLSGLGVPPLEYNSYGSRRGNHEVMWRGTFGNVRLQNKLVPEKTGGWTRLFPDGKVLSIYEAAQVYAARKTPLVLIAGKQYGSGSSRDWAAKGVRLLGVRAVLAESFERIHRSNLVGMGVAPLEFMPEDSVQKLKLKGDELISVEGLGEAAPRSQVVVKIKNSQGQVVTMQALLRIETPNEMKYFRAGGVLPYVLEKLMSGKDHDVRPEEHPKVT